MRGLSYLFLVILIIGGLVWGVMGITPSRFNIIAWVSPHPLFDRIVYMVIGFSAVWWIFAWRLFTRPRPVR